MHKKQYNSFIKSLITLFPKRKAVLLCTLLPFLSINLFAQTTTDTIPAPDTLNPQLTTQTPLPSIGNQRTKTINLSQQYQQIDTLTILSLKLTDKTGKEIPKTEYQLKNDSIRLSPNHAPSTVNRQPSTVTYRVAEKNLSTPLSRFDSTQVVFNTDGIIIGFDYDIYEEEKAAVVDFKGLDYQGNFSRGISFGNTQNLVLNSNFNLQMAGEIGDGIEVLAAITDENIPLQPEGNTQQLSEFDRIFIQLKKGNNTLIAGDYELTRPNSYFMNYLKKLQGATFSNQLQVFENQATLDSKASVAVARGKFARNTITVQEGNQGPYKLRGAAGERFIIILSGTEKIYWDGQLLTRGLENDYVVDYNQGVVTFTQKRLVTKDIRIIAEFDYSDQNYLRSIGVFNTEFKKGKMRTYLNAYTEQDSKSQSSAADLNEREFNALRNAGDVRDNIFLEPAVDSLAGAFDEFRVLYEYKDSITACGIDSVLVYSIKPETALFTAVFVEVPFGEGDYLRCDTCAANGDVYTYIARDPMTCEPQGNYRSARRLVPPEQRQLFTAGMEYQISKRGKIITEVALSNDDPNRFSDLGGDDNQGIAAFAGWQQEINLKSDTSGWKLLTNINYEFKQKNFLPLNPYRAAEFQRDWNLPTDNLEKANEQIGIAGLTLQRKQLGELGYRFSGFLRDGNYTGTKHSTDLKLNKNGWYADIDASLLQTEGTVENTSFLRPRGTISRTFKKLNNWKTGYYFENERNERRPIDEFGAVADSLNLLSFAYRRQRFFIESPKSDKFNIVAGYATRKDFAPVQNDFQQSTEAQEVTVSGNWRQARTANLTYNFTYRELAVNDSTLTTQKSAETYLGRADYNVGLWRGAIQSNTGYEIGSGQEQKIDFQYIQVNPGEGNFQWRDYNTDGVVQVNEIENFVFPDSANVQRVVIYTDEFIRVNTVNFNQNLTLNPRSLWAKKKGIRGALSRFSTKSNLQILRKVRVTDDVSPYNPFELAIADTSLVATTASINNSIFFNRSNQKFGGQFTRTDRRRKRVLTTGFESNANRENALTLRWNITKTIGLKTKGTKGFRQQDSELFNDKDYNIDYVGIEPQLTWQPNKTFNMTAAFKYQDNQNILPESPMETALVRDLNLKMIYKKATKSTISTKISRVVIDYTGLPNSPVGFALLQGLQPGENYLWNISFDRQLSKSLRMNLSYEGRKTGAAPVAHVGRAQVAATF